MNTISVHRLGRIIYPYWVAAKVSTLVVGSLVYLVLYEATRQKSERLRPSLNLKLNLLEK